MNALTDLPQALRLLPLRDISPSRTAVPQDKPAPPRKAAAQRAKPAAARKAAKK